MIDDLAKIRSNGIPGLPGPTDLPIAPSLLHVESASYAIGETLLVDDISFVLPTGGLIAVLGPNGAGKSTLLRLIAGALRPPTGLARPQVHLDGEDLLALSRRDRARRVALVEQSSSAEFALSVRQVVELGRTPHQSWWSMGQPETDLVDHALDLLQITAFQDRELSSLSGGEQQRVHLARALVQDPQLLLLDEPTNHLDISAQLEMLALLRELTGHASGRLTVVAALHDLNLALAHCDHVVVLTDGHLRAAGEIEQVLTEELIGQVYGVVADLLPHPRTGRPMVVFSTPEPVRARVSTLQ